MEPLIIKNHNVGLTTLPSEGEISNTISGISLSSTPGPDWFGGIF